MLGIADTARVWTPVKAEQPSPGLRTTLLCRWSSDQQPLQPAQVNPFLEVRSGIALRGSAEL